MQSKFGLVLLLVSSFMAAVGFSWSFAASLGPNADRNATLEPVSVGLMILALLLQIVAAGLFQSDPARPLRFLGVAVGCVAASFFGGIVLSFVFSDPIQRLARVLTKS